MNTNSKSNFLHINEENILKDKNVIVDITNEYSFTILDFIKNFINKHYLYHTITSNLDNILSNYTIKYFNFKVEVKNNYQENKIIIKTIPKYENLDTKIDIIKIERKLKIEKLKNK